MFDFALLFVAGVCQLALGIIGLRVSTRPPKKADRSRYELAFLVIGAAGLAAIVWSGLRSTSVQSGIADGVEKIEAKLGIKKDSAKQVSPANFDPVTGFNLCPQAWGRVPTKYYININGAGFQEYADKYKRAKLRSCNNVPATTVYPRTKASYDVEQRRSTYGSLRIIRATCTVEVFG